MSGRSEDERRVTELLVAKAAQHGTIETADETAILNLRPRTRHVRAGEDIVRQGDRPDVSVIVLGGMLARYHTIGSGDRQYLSFHIAGDLPDVQSLFLSVMDHSVCAMNDGEIGMTPHAQLIPLLVSRPAVAFAFWRLTLIDAAIFRQAVTNNGVRTHLARLAHFFCEQFYRAREAGLTQGDSCDLPLTQAQVGQALGISHISANRALQKLRIDRLADLRAERLEILNWRRLCETADFDPLYLHLDKESEISRTPFRPRAQ